MTQAGTALQLRFEKFRFEDLRFIKMHKNEDFALKTCT